VKAEPWVKTPLSVAETRLSLNINAQRFLDFLMIEHMRHAGQRNGFLLAPRRQLLEVGIGARHISPAIEEAERSGLVACKRGVGRRPSYYALTWLPVSEMTSEGKSLLMTSEGKSLRYPKGSHNGRSNSRREVTKPQNKGYPKGSHSIEGSCQGGAVVSEVEGKRERYDDGCREDGLGQPAAGRHR